MSQEQITELLQRIFAINEQIVRQNQLIMLHLVNPRIEKQSDL
jgi:hypothetical protein